MGLDKKLVLIISVILVVLIIGFLIFNFFYKEKIVFRQQAEKELRQQAEKEIELCKEAVRIRCDAVAKKDASLCEGIVNPKTILNDTKEKCREIVPLIIYYSEKITSDRCVSISTNYYSLSADDVKKDCTTVLQTIESKDESICNSSNCKYPYYIAKATIEKDSALCEKIGDDKVAVEDCKRMVSSEIVSCDYNACEESGRRILEEGINSFESASRK